MGLAVTGAVDPDRSGAPVVLLQEDFEVHPVAGGLLHVAKQPHRPRDAVQFAAQEKRNQARIRPLGREVPQVGQHLSLHLPVEVGALAIEAGQHALAPGHLALRGQSKPKEGGEQM